MVICSKQNETKCCKSDLGDGTPFDSKYKGGTKLGSKHSTLSAQEKKQLVLEAYSIKDLKLRYALLRERAPLDFHDGIKSFAGKLNDWRKSLCQKRPCSYGDRVDQLVASDVREIIKKFNLEEPSVTRVDRASHINIDKLRRLVARRCIQCDQVDAFMTTALGVSWADEFLLRHELPTYVKSRINSVFSCASIR
jgi:hypothetical protein